MDKKSHIINVATALFQQKGYMGVGLNELLTACNCSRGAFYHHFPLGKEQLLLTCLSTLRDYIAEDCERSFKEHPSAILAIQAIIGKLIADYNANGTIVGYTFTSIVSEMGAVSEDVRLACDHLYNDLTAIMAKHLEKEGLNPQAAMERAVFVVSSREGAVRLTLYKKMYLTIRNHISPAKRKYIDRIGASMQSQVQVKNAKLIAFVLMFATFLGLFGETALNMALTEIMGDFFVSESTAQWVTTGYLLVLAVFVPLSSYLVRWFTTQQLIIAAICLSLIGSIVGGISPNFTVLLIARVIQAMGTGIILPLMFSVVLMIFPIQKRGAVMGIVGLVLTAGPALGPTLAGLIISALNWHYIFWIMVVLYVALLFIAANRINNVSTITKPRIDVVSLLMSTVGFGGIVFALATLAKAPLSDVTVWLPLVCGAVCLILFTLRQLQMKEPMIDLKVFKEPMYALGIVMMFATMFMILSVAILTPLYLKSVLGFTAIAAGLLMLPGNVLNIIMSPIVGSNFDKVGAKIFTRIGFSMITISMILFILLVSATTPVWQVVVMLSIFFVGVSMTIMPAQTNAMNALPLPQYADGSAALNTLTQVAGAAGTAVAITSFSAGRDSYIAEFGEQQPLEFLAHGVNQAFIPVLVVAIVGLLCSLFIKNSRGAK